MYKECVQNYPEVAEEIKNSLLFYSFYKYIYFNAGTRLRASNYINNVGEVKITWSPVGGQCQYKYKREQATSLSLSHLTTNSKRLYILPL